MQHPKDSVALCELNDEIFESLMDNIKVLINTYRIIKAYVIGIAVNSGETITDEKIIRVIQALSKEIEHNKVFKHLLEM